MVLRPPYTYKMNPYYWKEGLYIEVGHRVPYVFPARSRLVRLSHSSGGKQGSVTKERQAAAEKKKKNSISSNTSLF